LFIECNLTTLNPLNGGRPITVKSGGNQDQSRAAIKGYLISFLRPSNNKNVNRHERIGPVALRAILSGAKATGKVPHPSH